MINPTQKGCDRCGNLFDPELVASLTLQSFDREPPMNQVQVCVNCAKLVFALFNFKQNRLLMEEQNRLAAERPH